MDNKERGICCFCSEECNPMSQSCGRCARLLTGYSLGWNKLPDYFKYTPLYENVKEEVVKEEVVQKHNVQSDPDVYYPICQKCNRKFPCLEKFREECFLCLKQNDGI